MEIALLLIMNKCISIYNSRHFPPQLINGSLITTVDDVSSRFFFTIFLSCFVFAMSLFRVTSKYPYLNTIKEYII